MYRGSALATAAQSSRPTRGPLLHVISVLSFLLSWKNTFLYKTGGTGFEILSNYPENDFLMNQQKSLENLPLFFI